LISPLEPIAVDKVCHQGPKRSRSYGLSMEMLSIIKLGLIGFAVVGILYSCLGTGFLRNEETGWWESLPQEKRFIFVVAIAASVLQTFL